MECISRLGCAFEYSFFSIYTKNVYLQSTRTARVLNVCTYNFWSAQLDFSQRAAIVRGAALFAQ